VQRALEVQALPGALPAQLVRPTAGSLRWFLDVQVSDESLEVSYIFSYYDTVVGMLFNTVVTYITHVPAWFVCVHTSSIVAVPWHTSQKPQIRPGRTLARSSAPATWQLFNDL
jgi:hypothetical protein